MMDGISGYLIRIICAAVIYAVVTHLTNSNKTQAAILKIMSGVFMLLTVLSPLRNLDIDTLTDWELPGSPEAQAAIALGKDGAKTELRKSIKEQLEAYILQEASHYGAELSVEIVLDDGDYPEPESVTVSGNISPYAKRQISAMLETQLGIPKEAQQWT